MYSMQPHAYRSISEGTEYETHRIFKKHKILMDRRDNGCCTAVCRQTRLLSLSRPRYIQLFGYNGRSLTLCCYNPVGNKKRGAAEAAVQRPLPVFPLTGFLLLSVYIYHGALLVSFRKRQLRQKHKLLFPADIF